MVSVPVRPLADAFACAANCTSEVPAEPDATIDSHGAPLVAVHPQSGGAVTRTLPAPPAAGADPLSDPSSNVQGVPDWAMLIVWLPTVSVPVRPVADAAFEVIVTPMVPLPVPDVGDKLAHGMLLDALHEQFAPLAVTAIEPTPPFAPYGDPRADVSTVTLHASASCVMTNGWPPIVKAP